MAWKHKAVLALMNNEFDGSRNEAGYTLALLFYAMGKDIGECEEFFYGEWFPNVYKGGKPYRLTELKLSNRLIVVNTLDHLKKR
jgi:hypothetical protein